MMPFSDLARYVVKRFKHDKFSAFIWRMIRFCYIAPHIVLMNWHISNQTSNRPAIKLINGSWMVLNPKKKGIDRDLLACGIREPFMTQAVANVLKKGDIVVDIGANIGYYALLESSKVGKLGHVYAIEPVPENCDSLLTNIRINQYTNISVHQNAIGLVNSTGVMSVSEMCNMSTLVKSDYRSYAKTIKVNVISLDNFMAGKPYPDLLRMDIEGYEYYLIKGASRLLSEYRPLRICMELHFDVLREKTREMVKELKGYGFKVASASFEPHPAILRTKNMKILKYLDTKVGIPTGNSNISMDDLMNNPIFQSGQVEDMEILFER